jgi:hypothetical protein
MTSQHHRSASATERKSITGNSRVNSTRAREYERRSMHEAGTPASMDEVENGGGHEDFTNRHERKFNGTEKRREKTTITTTETFLTRRSPLKEGANIANRSSVEKMSRSRGSPTQKKKPKEPEKGVSRAPPTHSC